VLMSAVSAYFYLRVLVVMYMKDPAEADEASFVPATADSNLDTGVISFSVWICAVSVLVLGIWPGWLSQAASEALMGLLS